MKVVVVSGGFDPLHSGHISYFKDAKSRGDKLIVAVNSDDWLEKKKGKFFMPFSERKLIIESIKYVDEVIDFKDDKIGSCIDALKKVKNFHKKDEIYFANGGDRDEDNIPEMVIDDINFLFSIGGDIKKNSSSLILKKWQNYHEERVWGSFFNLFESGDVKVKELIVDPGKGMSFQKHFKRSEISLVSRGSCVINYSKDNPKKRKEIQLNKFDYYIVPLGEWHQITNPFNEPCHLIEIQYGESCVEEDIERIDYYDPK